MRRLLPLALAALLALTLLPGLGAVEALDEREARDMVTAYESTARREWLTPIYGNQAFFEKPLPGYAPEVLARRALRRWLDDSRLHVSAVAWSRLVRAAFAVALALAVAGVGTSLFGMRSGWLAACALATMLGLPLAARADGVQVYATLCAWLGIGRMLAVLTGRSRSPAVTLTVGWVAFGAAAITGGLLPALWPLAGMALYFGLARNHDGWRALRLGSGLLIIAGACLPWYGLMVALHGASFVRAMPWFPYASGVRAAWFSGVPLALSFAVVVSFPWTPLLAAALADAANRLRRAAGRATPGPLPLDPEHCEHLLLALALASVLPIFVYPGPPLTSALPGLPAVALLVGRFVDRVLDGDGDRRAITQSTRLLAVLGTAFAITGMAIAAQLPEAARALQLFAAVTFAATWAPLLADLRGARKLAVGLFALPAALGAPVLHTQVLPALEPWLNARQVAEAMERVSPPTAPLVLFEPPPASLRQSLERNFVLAPSLARFAADAVARDGYLYAAFRPSREAKALETLARYGHAPEVLARTPVLVLVRLRAG